MKHFRGITVVLLALLVAACGKSEKAAEEKAASSEPAQVAAGEAPHWSYEGATGPANWGTLSPDFAPCGTGQKQSPIDIHETSHGELAAMRATFKPTSLRVIHHEHVADGINNGHTIQVNYAGGDSMTVGEETFQLVQYHFHSPSEHTVHGMHYPMEMHMVHKSAEGRLAVVGVFVREGEHNAAFDPVWSNLPATKGAETHLEHVTVDVNQMLPAGSESYRYEGSLTTPPCSEGVQWIVMANPIPMSSDQIAAFRKLIHGNNRPVQPLNGRTVVTDFVAEAQ